MKWIAQFHSHDEKDRKIIKVGIKKSDHLIGIYFDFDENDRQMCRSTEEEAITLIKECWSYMETFKMLGDGE